MLSYLYTILLIAIREVTRLRTRFKGRSNPIAMLLLIVSILLLFLTFRRGAVQGKGLYRVAVSPDGPRIQDERFEVVRVTPSVGYALLEAGAVDLYVDSTRVVHQGAEKSLYAAGALKMYLEKQELVRAGEEYGPEKAFPLRVGVQRFPIELSGQEETVLIPSLMAPPLPFAQVVTVSLHLFPVFFVNVFFTGGFMHEKTDKRITVLLSAPVTPFQIIAGKMLPYILLALASVGFIASFLKGNVLLALLIFTPVVLFTFSVYLMVPLIYRTFKDTTFISMLATTIITSYLVFPAMFAGINDLSYMSPLTLAIKMYRGQPFGVKEYLTSTIPMYIIFALAMYAGSRMLNEEYLMRFRPLYRKVADAIFLLINRRHINLSILVLSLVLVPIVYMVQLAALVVSMNLPVRYAVGALLVIAVIVEEVAKSVGIAVLIEQGIVRSAKSILLLSCLAGLGFLLGEKGLLYVSVSIVSETMLSAALFGAGMLWLPLTAHIFFTATVSLLTAKLGVRRYPLALLVGSALHVVYNLAVLGVI